MSSERSQRQILRDRIDYLIERYDIITSIYKELDNEFLEHMLTYFLIISRNYYINEKLINYMKNILKPIRFKIITSNIDIRVKIKIIKLMMSNSKKYLDLKNTLSEVQINTENYFN